MKQQTGALTQSEIKDALGNIQKVRALIGLHCYDMRFHTWIDAYQKLDDLDAIIGDLAGLYECESEKQAEKAHEAELEQ